MSYNIFFGILCLWSLINVVKSVTGAELKVKHTKTCRRLDMTRLAVMICYDAQLHTGQIVSHLIDHKRTNATTSWSLPEEDSESLGTTVGCAGNLSAFLCASNFNSYNKTHTPNILDDIISYIKATRSWTVWLKTHGQWVGLLRFYYSISSSVSVGFHRKLWSVFSWFWFLHEIWGKQTINCKCNNVIRELRQLRLI